MCTDTKGIAGQMRHPAHPSVIFPTHHFHSNQYLSWPSPYFFFRAMAKPCMAPPMQAMVRTRARNELLTSSELGLFPKKLVQRCKGNERGRFIKIICNNIFALPSLCLELAPGK